MKLTKKSIIFSVCALVAGLAIGLCPPPSEVLTGDSMRVLGILVGCIIMWAGNVVHECAVVLLMSALMAGLGHVPVATVFSAFSGSILWVLIAAFILGAAMKKSGLLRRVALLLLKVFPKNFAGTSIGLMAVGAVIGPPKIPSASLWALLYVLSAMLWATSPKASRPTGCCCPSWVPL